MRGSGLVDGVRAHRQKEGENRFVLRREAGTAYHEQRTTPLFGI